ncbi:MAG: hypothetical protein PHS81_04780 [Candidatus Nanoarchaeia archaeon]|nr:hypothetical protein [Candidatus Nanoarchaeia archaeon]
MSSSYAEWESGIDAELAKEMKPEDLDFAYSVWEKLCEIKNSAQPLEFDFHNCLNSMHYLFFKKPITVAPRIIFNEQYLGLSSSLELGNSAVYFNSLEPCAVLGGLFQYSIYHEYFFSKQMDEKRMNAFNSESFLKMQTTISYSLAKMIIPKNCDYFFGQQRQALNLGQCRDLAGKLTLI